MRLKRNCDTYRPRGRGTDTVCGCKGSENPSPSRRGSDAPSESPAKAPAPAKARDSVIVDPDKIQTLVCCKGHRSHVFAVVTLTLTAQYLAALSALSALTALTALSAQEPRVRCGDSRTDCSMWLL